MPAMEADKVAFALNAMASKARAEHSGKYHTPDRTLISPESTLLPNSDDCIRFFLFWLNVGPFGPLGPLQDREGNCHEGRIPPAGGGRLLSGGLPEVASVPVDDVHRARST